ncbi:unnamed protein product [Orchesella dallaii]|uniref:Uncharacterized protein n=1 Tax=Orchesella dallaii TaxID=48710 RepID=A0ABP1QSY9_9HEXA
MSTYKKSYSMENNIPGGVNAIKDKKNGRFFRKTGTSSATTTPVSGHPRTQPQRSFDSCSPLYASPLQMIGQQNIDPALIASLASGLNRHHQQQQQQQHHHHHQQHQQAASVAGTIANSPVVSGVQSPVIFNEHDSIKANGRRFMAAPRRARSAERFDGMRVTSYASGDLPTFSRGSPAGTPTTAPTIATPGVSDEQALYRNYRSPQVLRAGMVESGGSSITSSSPAPSLPLQPQLRQSAVASPVPSVGSTTNTGPIPSPPPPYSRAITETLVGPPSYNQAVAAMSKVHLAPKGKNSKVLVNGNNRYNLPHRGTQSLDTGNYIGSSVPTTAVGAPLITSSNVSTPGSNGLRTVSSHPAFLNDSSNDMICHCSKCQALARGQDSGGELNDAVYMESQAFLMHEIMNDGMAFCSVM